MCAVVMLDQHVCMSAAVCIHTANVHALLLNVVSAERPGMSSPSTSSTTIFMSSVALHRSLELHYHDKSMILFFNRDF